MLTGIRIAEASVEIPKSPWDLFWERIFGKQPSRIYKFLRIEVLVNGEWRSVTLGEEVTW